jgi:hypothetical protein
MALAKEGFTGETRYKEMLTNLEKYLYNVGQRHQGEYQEQRIAGIKGITGTLELLVNEVAKYRTKEWNLLNKE